MPQVEKPLWMLCLPPSWSSTGRPGSSARRELQLRLTPDASPVGMECSLCMVSRAHKRYNNSNSHLLLIEYCYILYIELYIYICICVTL